MDDNTTDPTLTASNKPGDNKHRLWLGLAVLAVVIIVAVGATSLLRHSSKVSYNFTYQKTESYQVPGTQAGRGMVFNKPSVYGPAAPNENTNTERGFGQFIPTGKTNQVVVGSRMLAGTNDYFKGPSAGLVKLINESMSKPVSDLDYQGSVRNAQNFARLAFLNQGVQMNFGHAQTFTSNYIKANAWKFDVHLTQNVRGIVPDETGELLFIIGQHTAYYFYVSAITDNWNNNSQFFQGVLNSVQIDR